MGNNIACCSRRWNAIDDLDFTFSLNPIHIKNRSISTTNLFNEVTTNQPLQYSQSAKDLTFIQHISEREPESEEIDPSLNVNILPRFLSGTGSCPSKEIRTKAYMRKWSSCGNVYISNNPVTKPDLLTILKCISYAVAIFLQRHQNIHFSKNVLYNDSYHLFDERKYPIILSSWISQSDPETHQQMTLMNRYRQNQKIIYQFLRQIFQNVHLTPECAIVALILFERLITSCELAVFNWTWRRKFFICIVISSKILDDQAIWNADYCQILRNVTVNDLNSLERHTLQLLQFNINVNRSIYIKYFFDLIALGKHLGVGDNLSNRQLLNASLAHKILLKKSQYRREKHIDKATIFDIAFPHNTQYSIRRSFCDYEAFLMAKGRGYVTVDECFLDTLKLQHTRSKIMEDFKEIQAEQVPSISSSTAQPHQIVIRNLYSSPKKYCTNLAFVEDNKFVTTTTSTLPNYPKHLSFNRTIENDYEHLLKVKQASTSLEPDQNPNWLDLGMEFF